MSNKYWVKGDVKDGWLHLNVWYTKIYLKVDPGQLLLGQTSLETELVSTGLPEAS